VEGIGYWLFLLILYLLSAFLRRRQREAARQRIETEAGEPPAAEPVKPADWLREIFGEEIVIEEEPVPEPYAETSVPGTETERPEPEYIPSAAEQPPEPDILVEETIEPETSTPPEKPSFAVLETAVRPEQVEFFASGTSMDIFREFLTSPVRLKQAIVLQEILGPPRALRRPHAQRWRIR
jgi:hypothetical protein